MADATAGLVDQAQRLVDRLRSLPESRLGRGEPSLADSAHALGQLLADLGADVEGRARREVPRLHDLASGDQVAVLARELAAAVDSAETFSAAGEGASAGNDRVDPRVAMEVALAAVAALRAEV